MPRSCADMAGRRALYLAVLASAVVFYIAYGQWLSWLILVLVAGLPWFSLAVSLPALVRFRISPAGPGLLEMGEEGRLWLLGSCPWPMPPFRGKLKLRDRITGKTWYYQDTEDLPTDHCGGIAITAEGVRLCDYLGLFSFRVRCREQKLLLIRPKPVAMELDVTLQRYVPRAWRPKAGGFSETHELRLYRPGDSLNRIHWKLSAKTGQLMLRQPMEPQRERVMVTLNHRGTPEEVDRKLGRLLWLGEKLLDRQMPFQLQALTGEGLLTVSIEEPRSLQKAVDTLLCRKAAREGDLRSQEYAAHWHCHIGGEPDEA